MAPTMQLNGTPDKWFNPAAFVLQPAGTYGNTGRGDFTGPNLRTLDHLSFSKQRPMVGARSRERASSPNRGLQHPEPRELRHPGTAGVLPARPTGAPLATFGRISNTVTSARQTQSRS